MEYLNFIVALQISFLFIVLFFKNKNPLNRTLAIIFLIPVLNFSFNILGILDLLPSLFWFLYFPVKGTLFLFAPLVFYYVHRMCGKKIRLTHPLFIVTAFIICYDLYLFVKYITLDYIAQEGYVRAIKREDFPLELVIFKGLFVVSEFLYYTLAAYQVCKFKKKVAHIFSKSSKTRIAFTQRFIFLILASSITISIVHSFTTVKFIDLVLLPFLVFIINGFIVFYAFKYQVIFNEAAYKTFLKDLKLINNTSLTLTKKSDDSTATKETTTIALATIKSYLIDSKSFLKLNYTVVDLAKDLNVTPAEISYAIKTALNKNFSKFINDLRVEESKSILKEKHNLLTIESIAELAGFNSRASFYRAFKEVMGITPTEYLKSTNAA